MYTRQAGRNRNRVFDQTANPGLSYSGHPAIGDFSGAIGDFSGAIGDFSGAIRDEPDMSLEVEKFKARD